MIPPSPTSAHRSADQPVCPFCKAQPNVCPSLSHLPLISRTGLGRPSASWNLPSMFQALPVSQPWGSSRSPVSPSVRTSGWSHCPVALTSSALGSPRILSPTHSLQSSEHLVLFCRGEGPPLCHLPPPGPVFSNSLGCNSLCMYLTKEPFSTYTSRASLCLVSRLLYTGRAVESHKLKVLGLKN